MSHSNHKEIHSDTEQIPTRDPQNVILMILLGKRLKLFAHFPRPQPQPANLWFAPYARNTVWAGIGNLVDLHQGERKLAMVDFNRFKPQAQTVPRQPAMKGRFV
jgi:hypothetical protein